MENKITKEEIKTLLEIIEKINYSQWNFIVRLVEQTYKNQANKNVPSGVGTWLEPILSQFN